MKVKFLILALIISGSVPPSCISKPVLSDRDDLHRTNLPPSELTCLGYSFRFTDNQGLSFEKISSETVPKDSTVEYLFNSLTDSIPVLKSAYEYDPSGNNTLAVSYQWDGTEDSWVFSRKYEYGYDEHSNQILNVSFEWDKVTGEWLKKNKTEHTYDAQDNHIMYIRYRWNSDSADWIRLEKSEKLNSAFDTIVRTAYSTWDTLDCMWSEQFRRISYLTPEGLAILRSDSTRDADTDTWTLTGTEVNAYTPEGLLLSSETYSWTNNGADSSGIIKWVHEYDEAGRETILTTYDWDDEEDSWVLNQQQLYSYNTEGDLTGVIRNLINETGDGWLEFMKWEISYLDFITIEAVYMWQEGTAAYEIFSKIFSYYMHDPDPADPDETIDFAVFPVPAEDYITITSEWPVENVTIYSLQGILLLNQEYTGGTIDITALPDGIYLLRMNENSGNAAGKFIMKQ